MEETLLLNIKMNFYLFVFRLLHAFVCQSLWTVEFSYLVGKIR